MSYIIRFIERRSPKPLSIELVFNEIKKYFNGSAKFKIVNSKMPYGFGVSAVLKNLLFFKKENADIYHITGDIHYIALRLPVNRTVITVHDAVLLNTRKGLRRYVLKKLYYDLPLSRAKYVTVISENTKKELVEKTNCDPEKIRVIMNPVFGHFTATEKDKFSDSPTILQVGTRSNKNLINLIKAVIGIDCKLRIIGRPAEAEIALMEQNNIAYSYAEDLSDEQVRTEYRNADIVAFCSTYEGFGLPILEAQGMRTPLITSDLDPMRQVAGSGSMLADPYDPLSIRSAIEQVIESESLRHRLVQDGLANLKRYKPEAIGSQYEQLYSEIINTG